MQSPEEPLQSTLPMESSTATPPTQQPSRPEVGSVTFQPKTLCACGCLGCLGFLLISGAVGWFAADKARTVTNSASTTQMAIGAVPQKYWGKWQGQDGTLVWIRSDGKGDYKGGNTSVTGGNVLVDEKARRLSIKFWMFGKELRIDQPPAKKGNEIEMKLDGMLFRKIEGF